MHFNNVGIHFLVAVAPLLSVQAAPANERSVERRDVDGNVGFLGDLFSHVAPKRDVGLTADDEADDIQFMEERDFEDDDAFESTLEAREGGGEGGGEGGESGHEGSSEGGMMGKGSVKAKEQKLKLKVQKIRAQLKMITGEGEEAKKKVEKLETELHKAVKTAKEGEHKVPQEKIEAATKKLEAELKKKGG